MLKIIPYKQNVSSFFNELDENIHWTAVTPSPLKSDLFREIINESGLLNIQSITISKFVKDSLGRDAEARKSKSELLMELWTIWKIKIGDSYNSFRYVFDLFTEIRSYTLELQLIEELKDLLTEEVYLGLVTFYQYFDSSNIVDEQRSYKVAGELFKNDNSKGLVFWGFDHLNSVQIDMIRKISEDTIVYIPLPITVLEQLDTFDWPYWLSTEEYQSENAAQEITQSTLRTIEVPKGRLSEYLSKIIKQDENSFLIDFNKGIDLTRTSSFLREGIEIKTNTDIFSIQVKHIFNSIHSGFNWAIPQKVDDLIEFIRSKKKEFFNKNEMRGFKVLSLLKERILLFQEYSKENESLQWSDLLVLKEVLELDLPRTSMISLIEEPKVKFMDRDILAKSFTNERAYLFIDASSDKLLRENSPYSADILSIFSAYGPSQNKKLESLMLVNDLAKLACENGTLICEEGAFEDSFEWDRILKKFKLEIVEVKSDLKVENSVLAVASDKEVGKLSATKVQSYIDCPRKFGYEYLNKIKLTVRAENTITPDIKGIVEHLLIEKYLETYEKYDIDTHKEMAIKLLKKELLSNHLIVNKLTFDATVEEAIAYTKPMIERLVNFKNHYNAKLYFELDLSEVDKNISGRIDLVVEVGEKIILLDFKRSSSGIPSKVDFESYIKLQMWFYTRRALLLDKELLGLGYINLSEPDKSLVYIINEEAWSEYLLEGFKMSRFKEDFKSLMETYEEYEDLKVKELYNDKEFLINPRNPSVCDFCVANPICIRGGSSNENS